MASGENPKSMNAPSERDPYNNCSYGTLVDQEYRLIDLPVLDVRAFNDSVIRAYENGTAEKELPADLATARSLIPVGTAALRDFSYVAPEIPEYIPGNCTGCMECVTLCPDTAILGKVQGEEQWKLNLSKIPDGADRDMFARQWSEPRKYYAGPKKKTGEGGKFTIIIDPAKCKGCAECVTVCGDDALKMITKTDKVVETIRKSHRFFKEIGPSDEQFVSDNLLVDMMLKEESHVYVGGAGSCAGCGEGTALRMMCAATGVQFGNDWGILAATGCNTVYTSTYPYNPYLVPWSNSLFENVATFAAGLRMRWDQQGWQDRPIWCIGGDGAMFDIGFQALSRLLASGMNVNVFVLDTQVYSNTGGQASTGTFTGQNAKMSLHGKVVSGKQERRKEIAQIAMMHPRTYVAQTTAAHMNHFYRSIIDALSFDGPSLVCCYTTCQPEHGVADNMATNQARLAVDSRAFPLLVYDPRKGDTIRQRLSLKGNPAVNDPWWTNPKTSKTVDFVDFARSEGRFAKQFDKGGNQSDTLLSARQDRLENWRLLQELAGLLDKQPAGNAKPAARKSAGAASLKTGDRIRYYDDNHWISGQIESLETGKLVLDDHTSIQVDSVVLKQAIDNGIIVAE